MDPSGRLGLDAEPDAQHGFGDVLDVVRRDVAPAGEERAGLRQPLPDQQPARAQPEGDLPMRARGMGQGDEVLADRRADGDLGHAVLERPELAGSITGGTDRSPSAPRPTAASSMASSWSRPG